jgi:phage gp46-like protein
LATNVYQGDPRLFLGKEGSYLDFVNGQPKMDAGLENTIIIPLGTRRRSKSDSKPWVGNLAFSNTAYHLGTDFLEGFDAPITFGMLEDVKQRAEKALQFMIDANLASEIIVETVNPNGYRIDLRILIRPPNLPESELVLIKNGINWLFQAGQPAGGGITTPIEPTQNPYGFGDYAFGDEEFGEGS